MTETVNVRLKDGADRSYEIVIGSGALALAAEDPAVDSASKIFVVCDSNVAPLYGGKLVRSLQTDGRQVKLLIFPAGESSKNRREKERLEDSLFAAGAGRDSLLFAVGGGVTTDLAGFVAATFMRGIKFINVPTTLLAAVDASVGGKTGIDVPSGKNLLGAFWQPSAVYIDVDAFNSLPAAEIRNGLAEMVKHGVIADAELFSLMEQRHTDILALNAELITDLVRRNCRIKASVVSADEREGDLRQILNYGHTIGHAIEKLANYSISHGEAVAAGMAAEGEIACRLALWPRDHLLRQNELLQLFGLPIKARQGLSATAIVEAASSDKKARGGKVRYSLPEAIGKMSHSDQTGWARPVADEIAIAALAETDG